jgi:hypothetical protein
MGALVACTSSEGGIVESRGEKREKPPLVKEALALDAVAAEPEEAEAHESSSGTVVSCGRIETRFVLRASSARVGLVAEDGQLLVLALVPSESNEWISDAVPEEDWRDAEGTVFCATT